MIFATGTAALIAILTIFLRRQVLVPLNKLHQSVAASTQNVFPLPIPVTESNEIGELSKSFNLMCDNLVKRETKLQEQAEMLEEEIAERQIAQEELVFKQNELEALNLSLEDKIKTAILDMREKDRIMLQQSRLAIMGEMISNIAHQWRQPLNNIGLMIQNIGVEMDSGELDPANIHRLIDDSMTALIYLSQTIDDFRNFFRPEKEMTKFTLSTPVENTMKLLKSGFDQFNISLKRSGDNSDIWVMGHQNELAQALMNIILNSKDALIARKSADPLVTITTTVRNGTACIDIEDNAGGISADIIDSIFDPYFTTKHQSQGTGLGLYISKMIVEKSMNGQLSVNSTSAGSVFTITLPLES